MRQGPSLKPHLFAYKDVHRIVKVVQPSSDYLKPDTLEIFATILSAESDMLKSLSDRGLKLFELQGGVKACLDTLDFLLKLVRGAPLSLLNEIFSRIVQAFGFAVPAPAPPAPPPPTPTPPTTP
jgi:hypothetical protein